LEGEFTSLYFNRLLPFQNDKHIDKSKFTQQVVISDGDVIKNELVKGQVMELGFDRYTGNTYGNKDFLLNTANYLLGDEDLVKLRSKSIKLPILSQEKIEASQNAWKTILLVGGLFIFGIISFLFSYLRKRAYT